MGYRNAATRRAAVWAASGGDISGRRAATLARIQRAATAAQTNNAQDVAPLGIAAQSLGASFTLPQLVTYQANPGSFEVLGGFPQVSIDPASFFVIDGDLSPNAGGLGGQVPDGTQYTQFVGSYGTRVQNGRYVEIGLREASLGGFRLFVNGRLAGTDRNAISSSGGVTGANWFKFDLGAVGDYVVETELSNGPRFIGVRAEAGATISKPTRAETVVGLFVGDSYTAGSVPTLSNTRGESLMSVLARYLGIKNAITAGLPGSAYLAATGAKSLTNFYLDHVKPRLLPYATPDVVVIAGGYNDTGTGMSVPALAQWQQVRSDCPAALIVIVGQWTPPNQNSVTLSNKEAALKTAFDGWADPFSLFLPNAFTSGGGATQRPMFGTGRGSQDAGVNGATANPTFDGINDYIVKADGVHLTDSADNRSGNWYVARKLLGQFIEKLNALGSQYNPGGVQVPRWPLVIKTATATVPAATVGSPYLLATLATGGATARTFSILSGTIPPGLTLQTVAGHLTGTPTTSGTYNFTIRANDGISNADLPVTIVVG